MGFWPCTSCTFLVGYLRNLYWFMLFCWTEGYTSKEVVKKPKGFWHSITFIESKLHVAVLCHWSKAGDEMRQDATSHGNNLSSVPLHGRSSFGHNHSHASASICLSDMSSKINQHEPDINQQWAMTLMNILCMIHTWIIIIIIIIIIIHISPNIYQTLM